MKGFPPSNFGTIWASQRLMTVIEYKHCINKNPQVYPMFKIFKRKKDVLCIQEMHIEGMGFSHGSAVKNLPPKAGDMGVTLYPEDPTCRGATRPMRHSYIEPELWSLEASTTEPRCCKY